MIFFLLSLLGLVPTFQKEKCKKLLHITVERIKRLSNRREAQLRQLRIDLGKLVQLEEEQKAQAWIGHIHKEVELLSMYNKISAYCELVQGKLKSMADQSSCPEGLEEPLAGLCFAASCCADLPELQELREIFGMKYGKHFVTSVQELGQRCLVKKEAIETGIISKEELKQGKEQVLQQQVQERPEIMDADECNIMPNVEDAVNAMMNDGKNVEVTAMVQDSAAVSRVCEEDFGTTEVALALANRKKTSKDRQTWRSTFKRACKKRQTSVNTSNEGDDNANEVLAMKTQEDDKYKDCNAHDIPSQHIVLHLKEPMFYLPPQRPPPPPPPPPPSRAPPAPPQPIRVASMPSSHYMKHEVGYTNTPLPARCSTMAIKIQHNEDSNASYVHPRLPKYEDLVANFTALKH